MKSEQQDGTDYEFTVVLDLTHDGHTAMASKDRTKLFEEPELITEETGKRLLAWLNSGVSPEDRAKELLVDALTDIATAKDMAGSTAHGIEEAGHGRGTAEADGGSHQAAQEAREGNNKERCSGHREVHG